MTGIDLTHENVHDLLEVLDYRLSELHAELVHTDDRAYRDDLRAASNRLEELRERVQHIADHLPPRDEPSPIARKGRPLPV